MINLSLQGERGNQGEPGVAGKNVCISLYVLLVMLLIQSGYECDQTCKTYGLNFDMHLAPHACAMEMKSSHTIVF